LDKIQFWENIQHISNSVQDGLLLLEENFFFLTGKVMWKQWRTQKISEGEAKLRHNRVTSQINFRGNSEGTRILAVSGGMPPGRFSKITPKNTHFLCILEASFRQYCF